MKAQKTKWRVILLVAVILCLRCRGEMLHAQEIFRVHPYLQWPAPDSISVLWFSENAAPGVLEWWIPGEGNTRMIQSEPSLAEELDYTNWEDTTFFSGGAPTIPFRHVVRLGGLSEGTRYEYQVVQEADTFRAQFRTAPAGMVPIRFVVYGDPETEPESTGNHTRWIDPVTGVWRLYPVDQTTGYGNNLEVIRSRNPDLVLIAGDLVRHGGEQRDWDEFWRHNTDPEGSHSLAGQYPILAVPGNHDYYEGSELGGYSQPGSERAIQRYLTYFTAPGNHSPNADQEGRFYAIRYGPVTIIALDLCNNGPNGSSEDTNFLMLGEDDEGGGPAPGFMPGSYQYVWLEEQLGMARDSSLFTFVMFHYAPYSSGPHGWPPGLGDGEDYLSGVPARELTPLFLEYGVDAVFSGHDEMWERSEIPGVEVMADGSSREHTIQFYDVGTGGDELRAPEPGLENPYQQFLAHRDAPELWNSDTLVEGGKHYGHLEVEILPDGEYTWNAVLTPVYILPVRLPGDTLYLGFERKVYADQVILTEKEPAATGYPYGDNRFSEREPGLRPGVYPNPFHESVNLVVSIPEPCEVILDILTTSGAVVRTLREGASEPGTCFVTWDGRDSGGSPVPPGIYLVRMRIGNDQSGNDPLRKWASGTSLIVKVR